MDEAVKDCPAVFFLVLQRLKTICKFTGTFHGLPVNFMNGTVQNLQFALCSHDGELSDLSDLQVFRKGAYD